MIFHGGFDFPTRALLVEMGLESVGAGYGDDTERLISPTRIVPANKSPRGSIDEYV